MLTGRVFFVFLIGVWLCSATVEDCSGNGIRYPDRNVCECYDCFSGDNCEIAPSFCSVDSTFGNPFLWQEYWMNYGHSMIEAPTFRSPYFFLGAGPFDSVGIMNVLVPQIKRLHEMYQNAETEGRTIVFGNGGTHLINAVNYAYAELAGKRMTLFAKSPYYPGYPDSTYLDPSRVAFSSSTKLDPNSTIEFVTHPNNPDGELRTPVYPSASLMYDCVYYWPSLVNVSEGGIVDEDLALFSLSKLTGHGGSRLGWALVKDPEVAYQMNMYLNRSSLHVGSDSLYRAYNLIQNLLDQPYHLFDYIREKMLTRWNTINNILAGATDRFSQTSRPGTFYLWIQCLNPVEAKDCVGTFSQAGLVGGSGVPYGGTDAFVRLEIVCHDTTFQYFIQNLQTLVATPPSSY